MEELSEIVDVQSDMSSESRHIFPTNYQGTEDILDVLDTQI